MYILYNVYSESPGKMQFCKKMQKINLGLAFCGKVRYLIENEVNTSKYRYLEQGRSKSVFWGTFLIIGLNFATKGNGSDTKYEAKKGRKK